MTQLWLLSWSCCKCSCTDADSSVEQVGRPDAAASLHVSPSRGGLICRGHSVSTAHTSKHCPLQRFLYSSNFPAAVVLARAEQCAVAAEEPALSTIAELVGENIDAQQAAESQPSTHGKHSLYSYPCVCVPWDHFPLIMFVSLLHGRHVANQSTIVSWGTPRLKTIYI